MAAKGGLKMLTKAMAVEWGKYNIQVNGIGPGWMVTELNRPLMENPQTEHWQSGARVSPSDPVGPTRVQREVPPPDRDCSFSRLSTCLAMQSATSFFSPTNSMPVR